MLIGDHISILLKIYEVTRVGSVVARAIGVHAKGANLVGLEIAG